jgi:hypothetical protein
MAPKAPSRRPRARKEFVRVGNQHVPLPRSGVLKLGVLSIDFHERGANQVIGMEAHCCKGDFSGCVLRKAGTECGDTDKPITVWYFTER